MASTSDEFIALIAQMLTPESAARVERYLDPGSHYAGATFDTVGLNPDCSFDASDLLAVHLLGMEFDPLAVRLLLQPGEVRERIESLFSQVPTQVQLWDDSADTPLAVCDELWAVLNDLPGVGWVTAGKLMARKRPRLIPILDQVVYDYFQPPKGEFWGLMRSALRVSDLPFEIETTLRPKRDSAANAEGVSTLRLLDIAVWMHGMSARSA